MLSQKKLHGIWVLILTGTIFFLESVLFHVAIFTHDYLLANTMIAYALFGMAIGGVIAYFLKTLPVWGILFLSLLLVLFSVAGVLNLLYYPDLIYYSPFLWGPFVFGAVLIIYFFKIHASALMYGFDLLGATMGVLLSVVLIPFLRVENALLLVWSLLLFWCGLYGLWKGGKYTKFFLVPCLILLSVAGIFFLKQNLKQDKFNLAKLAQCGEKTVRQKIFCWGKPKNVEYSQDTLIQRIDVQKKPNSTRKNVAYDGFSNDSIYSRKTASYVRDQRIVHGLIEEPGVMVIGGGAEGVLKPLKNETAPENIDVIEINPAVIKIMTENYYELSDRAYEGVRLIPYDALTYLKQTEKTYDLITLMNTHLVKTVHYFGGPEYLHTQETIEEYLRHLSDRGHIMIEERENTKSARQSQSRIIATFYAAMKAQGIAQPEDHIIIYSWYPYNTANHSANYYVNMIFKKTPITDEDMAIMGNWKKGFSPEKRIKRERIYYEYVPGSQRNMPLWSGLFETLSAGEKQYRGASIIPISDNRPFPFPIESHQKKVQTYFLHYGMVPLVAALGLALFIFFRSPRAQRKKLPGAFVIFGILGIVYLMIEIFLMEYYNKFMGGPSYAMIFILASLLLSSGIGSFLLPRFSIKTIRFLLALIPVLLIYHFWAHRWVMELFAGTPLQNAFLIAFSVMPLGFCMGLPFPYFLEKAKQHFSASLSALFFSYNLLFSSLAVFVPLVLSVSVGFTIIFWLGMGFYLLVFVLSFRSESLFK